MTVDAGAPRRAATIPAIPLRSRIYGFGSIFGKTMRDSRLSFLIVTGVLVGMMFAAGAAMESVFPTPESRKEVDAMIATIPASLAGLFGNPIKVDTLGGVVNWKYGPFFVLGAGLWSILALSSTLAGEAARGSLDLVATAPFGKRRVALEKLGAHVVVMTLAMAALAVSAWLTAQLFGDLSLGDAIPPEAAIGFALWVGLLALAFGGMAFALGPLLGRAGAAGVAGLWMAVGWFSNGFAALDPIAVLTPWKWTADQAAIVGVYDWPALVLVGVTVVVLFAVGVELFARRDVGVTLPVRMPRLPRIALGVGGPEGRAFADQAPNALGWGVGLGLLALMLASLVGAMADEIAKQPVFRDLLRAMFPDFDITSTGGFLQAYAQFLFILVGYAAATFVAKWSSDEQEGRLEMVLTSPLQRARWVVAGGVGAVVAVVLTTMLIAIGIGVGAASADVASGDAILGTASLAFYGAAIVGIGVAVGGVWRTSLAAEIAAVVVTATFLVDLLAPPLGWPEWIRALALTSHMGQPMVGEWDPVGLVACAVIAVGGTLLGAWGMSRRDIAR